MSPGSRCHSFEACGDGYGKGEGFVVLVLKRLSHALKDGDLIRAVIRATSTNQDGRTPGISQPSVAAQEDSIRKAYRSEGLDLAGTRLFETHGAGTSLGDRTEASAIRSVFQPYRSPEDPMYIGAVKANIGHLGAAAGLTGVVKTNPVSREGYHPAKYRSRESEPWYQGQGMATPHMACWSVDCEALRTIREILRQMEMVGQVSL